MKQAIKMRLLAWGCFFMCLLLAPAFAQRTTPFVLPAKAQRHLNHTYAFDASPLGNRIPIIILPGRTQEKQQNPWWKKFHRKWLKAPDLVQKYKLYLFLYDSTQDVRIPAYEFRQELHHFVEMLGNTHKKVVLISYSQGGLIARDALVSEPALMRYVDTIFGISVPYHGSPLFDKEWLAEEFKHYSPLRRGMDRFTFATYMNSRSYLSRNMNFVNFDTSKPNAITPKKVLGLMPRKSVPLTPNPPRWTEKDEALRTFKLKLIVYASYLKSPYSEYGDEGRLREDLTNFGTIARLNNVILGAVVPTYYPSVHRTLEFMGRQLSQLTVANVPHFNQPKQYPRGHGHPFRFNDGVIPASSLFYLPVRNTPYTEYIGVYPRLWDICDGRFFNDLDHVDLGHYRFPEFPLVAEDVFHANEKARKPMQWLFDDLKRLHTPKGFHCG